MDDLNEQVIKKSPQLHNEIKSLIAEFGNALMLPQSDKILVYQSASARLVAIVNEFELQPKLLEKQLGFYIGELSTLFLKDKLVGVFIGNVVYAFSKVCTFKTVALFFSSDVYLIDRLIESCHDANETVRFVSLLWLCNLVLVPFPIKTIGTNTRERMIEAAEVSLTRFTNASRTQVAALILYSRLLSRPDCKDVLDSYLKDTIDSWFTTNLSQKLGALMIINKLLKRVELSQVQITGIQSCINGDFLESHTSNMSLIYSIKILCKLAVSYIKRGLFVNVATLVNNLINDILLSEVTFETNLRYAMAKALSTIVAQLSYTAVNYHNQLIEFIINLIDSNETNVPKLHTVLLTLGYVALSKNLPVQFQANCIELASKYLFFKISKGTIVIGNQVRDSSCFLIWAVVRNLKQSTAVISNVFVDLLKVLVFDDLLLKRCSVAVIQEILGRLGNDLVNTNERGAFIVNFVSKLSHIRLNQHICYEFIDTFFHDFDLSFLIPPLADAICEEDGDGFYLNKLLQQPLEFELVPKRMIDFDQIISRLKLASKWHVLFQLDGFKDGYQVFDDFVFEESKLDMIKGYLFSLKHKQLTELDWNNVLKILRYVHLVEEFREVVLFQDDLPMQEILYHLPNDRNLSCTIFNFQNLQLDQYRLLLKLMKDPRIDVTVRANLIDNLAANIPVFFKLEDIYSLFDDYTTTDQGDVGSKIRISVINLVVKNSFIDDIIQLKLIRLSGELMDKIRHLSFKALTGESFSWRRLFEYKLSLNGHQSMVEFWQGIVFTCGSFIGNTKIINESFIELLSYRPTKEDFDIWFSFLEKPQVGDKRQVKLVSMVLQMILKLFDANYQFEDPITYQSLFVKCYNLHINTKNLARVMTVLQIFLHISQRYPELRTRVYDRFLWILANHPLKELKTFVGENILFELMDSDSMSRYELIDWFDIKQSDLVFIEGVFK